MSSDAQKKAEDMEIARHHEAEEERLARDQFSTDLQSMFVMAGRYQASAAISDFSGACGIFILSKIKESKEYRKLKGLKSPCGAEFLGTWEDFCSKLTQKSVDIIDDQIKTLHILGPDAYESMQKIGANPGLLRKLRAIPEEDRQLIIESEAVDAGDKEALRELIEDVLSKRDAERQRLQTQLDEQAKAMEAECEANSKVSAERNIQNEALAKENHLLNGRSLPWDERIAPLKDEMNMCSNVLDEVLGKMLIMHQAILGVDLDDDVRDVARRSLVTRYAEVLDRAAVLVAECQGMFDLELGGYIGSMREFLMQLPGEDLPTQVGDGPVERHPVASKPVN